MGSHYVAQAGLELLASGDPPTLASQNAELNRCEPPSPASINIKRGKNYGEDFHTISHLALPSMLDDIFLVSTL